MSIFKRKTEPNALLFENQTGKRISPQKYRANINCIIILWFFAICKLMVWRLRETRMHNQPAKGGREVGGGDCERVRGKKATAYIWSQWNKCSRQRLTIQRGMQQHNRQQLKISEWSGHICLCGVGCCFHPFLLWPDKLKKREWAI